MHAADMENMLRRSLNRATYFFTIPPESAERNCSGTVVTIQFCYRIRKNLINSTQDVLLFHSVTRDGFDFTVNGSFTVRTTPHQSECAQSRNWYLCCDTTTLSAENQLSISPESYTFGVTIVNKDVTPYAFRDDTEFVIEQFQAAIGTTIPVGTSYTLAWSEVSDGLLLMRFMIGKITIIFEGLTLVSPYKHALLYAGVYLGGGGRGTCPPSPPSTYHATPWDCAHYKVFSPPLIS